MEDTTTNIDNFTELTHFFNEQHITAYETDTSIIDIIKATLEKSHLDTGFFIVDLSTVINQYKKWINFLPRIKPYYAIKCNPDQLLIKTLAMLGVNFDCASKNEIIFALDATNNDASRIIFANPAKADSHLKYARGVDVDLMTFDNMYELFKIVNFHPSAQLVLRIKVDDSFSVCRFNSKFGADIDNVDGLMKLAKTIGLDIVGVSFHVGSGCKNVDAYKIAIERSRKVFDIGKENGYKLKILDIGGGFPGTLEGFFEQTLDKKNNNYIKFEDIAKTINESIDIYFPESDFPEDYNLQIIAEPGRYFASASHTLVLNVIAKNKIIDKQTKEVKFAYTLNDGVYGSFNCIMFDHAKPIIKPFNERDGHVYDCTVYGPTCDSMDTISNSCKLPDLAIGESVYIEDSGAYTTAAASNFNGFQRTPCEYIMRY
jgi:diaminopimelate decarboxylase